MLFLFYIFRNYAHPIFRQYITEKNLLTKWKRRQSLLLGQWLLTKLFSFSSPDIRSLCLGKTIFISFKSDRFILLWIIFPCVAHFLRKSPRGHQTFWKTEEKYFFIIKRLTFPKKSFTSIMKYPVHEGWTFFKVYLDDSTRRSKGHYRHMFEVYRSKLFRHFFFSTT